jgi:hypothetical protein
MKAVAAAAATFRAAHARAIESGHMKQSFIRPLSRERLNTSSQTAAIHSRRGVPERAKAAT